VGLSADRRRAEGRRCGGLGNHRQEDSPCCRTRPDDSARAVVARVPPYEGQQHHRGGFLYGRYGVAPAIVRAVLHRVGSRRVHLAGCTAHPDEVWVTQQARQVTWGPGEREEPVRFLIRDRDRKFTSRFDAVFEAQAVRVVRTPVQTPEANGIAERFVRTVRSECLDWLLILNPQHLEHTLNVFVDHYNSGRPHRSLGLVPPKGRLRVKSKAIGESISVRRRDRLGGLLHEYERAA
jgi:transposase InsO family protein